MRYVVSFVFIVLAVVGSVAFVRGDYWLGPIVVQPIEFNHAVHLEKAGMECAECHTDAMTGVYAGLPGKDLCLDCHDIDEEDHSQPEKARLFAFEESDDDIPWVRVAVTRPDVYFSHRRHVSSAGLDCLECHTDQAGLTRPPARARLVMTMTACIECHEKNGASEDCLACHR